MEQNNRLVLVDPPSGWAYGFPKPFTFVASGNKETYEDELHSWFIENGYPAALIANGNLKYCRYLYP